MPNVWWYPSNLAARDDSTTGTARRAVACLLAGLLSGFAALRSRAAAELGGPELFQRVYGYLRQARGGQAGGSGGGSGACSESDERAALAALTGDAALLPACVLVDQLVCQVRGGAGR